MTGVVIITHNNLSFELLKIAELILGEHLNIKTLGFSSRDSENSDLKKIIENAIKTSDRGNGVLVLIDIFGTSCAGILTDMIKESSKPDSHKINFISGVNLPMVIAAGKGILNAETDLDNFTREVKNQATRSIIDSSEFL